MDSVTSVLGGPGSYPISAVIIAQDDEIRISKAIQSCRLFADEVVVIDGGSKDGTVALSQSLNCRVYVNPWPGYAKQREFGVERAVHDWVFLRGRNEYIEYLFVHCRFPLNLRPCVGSHPYASRSYPLGPRRYI